MKQTLQSKSRKVLHINKYHPFFIPLFSSTLKNMIWPTPLGWGQGHILSSPDSVSRWATLGRHTHLIAAKTTLQKTSHTSIHAGFAGAFLHSHFKDSLWEQAAFTTVGFAIMKLLTSDTIFGSPSYLGWSSSLLGASWLKSHCTWTEGWHQEMRKHLSWEWGAAQSLPAVVEDSNSEAFCWAGYHRQDFTGVHLQKDLALALCLLHEMFLQITCIEKGFEMLLAIWLDSCTEERLFCRTEYDWLEVEKWKLFQKPGLAFFCLKLYTVDKNTKL